LSSLPFIINIHDCRKNEQSLESGEGLTYNIGTDKHPEIVKITNIYMDTDADFTRNPRQFASMHEDLNVQVKLEYVAE
jgi:hypothetical protein